MVIVLDSKSNGPGTLGCVLGQDSPTVPLSKQEYKWVPVNLILEVNTAMD